MERLKNFWNAFKDIAILFSFVVNFVLVVTLLVISIPALHATFALKTGMVEPLLNDLDAAFLGLGEATIDTTVQIDEPIPIQFNLPLDQPMPIEFQLAIEQNTTVVLQQPVPLNAPAQFNLPGGGGVINGSVSMNLPVGMRLPVHLRARQQNHSRAHKRAGQRNYPHPDERAGAYQVGRGRDGPGRGVFLPLKEQIEALPDGF